MFRSTFVCLLVAGVLIPAMSSAAAPVESAPPTPAPSPEPIVYTLGAPLSAPRVIQVDEYGRIYILDHARQAVMRFSQTGELEKLWQARNSPRARGRSTSGDGVRPGVPRPAPR